MQDFFDWFIYNTKKIMPGWLYKIFEPAYHFTLAFLGALYYRFPSNNLFVIAITGTKGKTSTVEYVSSILEEAGYNTAIASTIRFKIGKKSSKNIFKMTMPGRFFLQKFMRDAIANNCTHVVIEMTSEGAKQYRHKFINLDALIFTNISKEHIESHGSYEKYIKAKLSIAKALSKSKKRNKYLIVNKDDPKYEDFLRAGYGANIKRTYSLEEVKPYGTKEKEGFFTFKNTRIKVYLSGLFNIYNALAAATFADSIGIDSTIIKKGVENVKKIKGRMEYITSENDPFQIIIDYAHTPDSLQKILEAVPGKEKVCVFGATGGGRDKWKRPEMGRIAAKYCKKIILTDDDPYDEDRLKIIDNIKEGIDKEKATNLDIDPEVIIEPDRRKAIDIAINGAKKGDTIIIAGKGADAYLMGPNNTKTEWDDAKFAMESFKNRKMLN